MKRLYVVRHAKASYPNDVSDYNRPLAKQGFLDIQNLSHYLKSKKFIPEYILTSASNRTLETCKIISKALHVNAEHIQKEPLIYGAPVDKLLNIISSIDIRYNALMVVGHNPTITLLINEISDALIDHVPASGVAIIDFEKSDWSNLVEAGKLLEFVYPKKLKSL